MPGGLPPVLITNTNTITEEIDNPDPVQVEDVAKLWRVYTLNSTHMEDDEGARLENFFWRIWSNRSVLRSIRGNTLARLFITISQGGNRVRTTPVPSPLCTTPTQSSIAAAAHAGFAPLSPEKSEQLTTDTGGSPRRTSDQLRTLPPILKKSRTDSDEPVRPAKILSSDTNPQDSKRISVRRGSGESTGALSSPCGPTEKGSKNAGKKRTSLPGAAGMRKARPGTTRKRSSQTSATSESRRGSQTSPSLGLQPGRTTLKSGTGLPQLTTAAFALSSGSWQDVDSLSSSSRDPIENAISSAGQPPSWLVDKNFRGRFVEHQKRATSSINLAALGKTQSVRFLDEMPEHRRLIAKGNRTHEIITQGGELVEVAGGSPPPSASAAIEEEDDDDASDTDDDDGPALPRTKSQLSMLIDKERKYSASTNLGLEPTKQENRYGRDKSNAKDDDGEEENELLVMARRDNKGKATDPDQPFKAAAKKGLWKGGGDDDDIGRSRSPPPVF